ncbi:DUF4178 domain-containing protein [bacterium]|nr:DUF4178 domain-containing protein [bacterium]MBU1958417.1 DUF4178 domain-containing protein [bacterium]
MSNVQSIKCSNCAAPLKLLGGGRVMTVTCPYCKSVLDLNDNYKVLSNFRNTKVLNRLPFDLGMKGELKGIDYTIIGRVDYRVIEYPDSQWTDFLLFSPLYGYTWLTYEEGGLSYSRRDRNFPNLEWHEIRGHSHIVVGNRSYETYDSYSATISYVEGELTWVAKKNDNISFIDSIAPPYGISAEKSKEEIEYYKTEYLKSDEVYSAFNVPKEKRELEAGFNPLKPFEQPFLKAFSYISMWVLLIVALFFLAVKLDGQGKILNHFTADSQGVKEAFFTLDSTKYLTSIVLKSASTKMLNNFNIKLHKEGHLLFTLTQKNAYRFDYETQKVVDSLKSWEQSAKEGIIYLNLERLGAYKLSIEPIDKSFSSSVKVTVKEKSARVNYLLMFAIVLVIFIFLYRFMRWRHHGRLEQEQGISDEDDETSSSWRSYLFWFTVVIFLVYLDLD